MSLTLNMIGGGSGGGISGNTAVLEVIAPTGSTVSITDGVTTKTQTAADGHPISGRQTVEAYIFPVGSDELGNWTVTATRVTETNTTTITISAIMDYVIYISYHVPIQTYQEVEYLASTGTQYIITNFKPSPQTEFDITFSIDNAFASGSTFGGVFAAREDYNKHTFALSSYTSNISVYRGTFEIINTTYPDPNDARITQYTKQTLTFHNFALFSDNPTVGGTTTISQRSYTINSRLALFAYNSGSSVSITRQMKGKIYFAKFWSDSSTVALELYPCYRLSDSVAGLYDKQNDVFYTNGGSGTFTVGADV